MFALFSRCLSMVFTCCWILCVYFGIGENESGAKLFLKQPEPIEYIFCLLSVFTYIQYYKISTRFSISIVSRLNASCHRHHHHDSSLHLAGKIIERMPKMQSRIFQNQVCEIKMLLQCWCNYFI